MFPGLAPNTYSVTARLIADNTCISTASNTVTVNNPAPPAAPVISVTTQATCAAPTGTVTVAPVDPTLEYSIDGTNYNTTGVFPGLAPNTYSVTARLIADNTCISAASNTVTVNNPAPPAAPVISVTTQATCAAPTGTVTVAPVDPTLEYSIDGTNYNTTGVFPGLAPNTYSVTTRLIADNTCISTASNTVTVNTPAPPAAPVISVNRHRQPAPLRLEQVTVAPVDPTLEYSIDGTNYNTTGVFPGLAPNTYSVTAETHC